MNKHKLKRRLVFPAFFIFLIALFSFSDPGKRYFEIAKNMEILSSVYSEINKHYVDEIDPNEIMKKGIDGMLESLDPYTTYISEDKIEDFRFLQTGQYGGIGALIGNRNNKILVLMPYEDFPAVKAGMKIGDEIITIDGEDVRGKNTNDISKLLKGQAGTKVKVEVLRYNASKPITLDVTREKISVKSVPYYDLLSEDVGYMVLTSFTQTSSSEVKNAMEELKKRGAKKFILDLRGNPGGLLKEAISISNFFIEKGKEIVSTRGKSEQWNHVHNAPNDALDKNSKLVILIDGSSASASEIVSGVIQDYDRGVLIGSKTFGKGLVQATFPTAYNSQVKVTTAKYYIPSGRCIQRLDYSNKNEKGEGLLVPDSLLVPYKTMKGRLVLDGEGITPDITIKPEKTAEILQALVQQGVIFDFATKYYYEKDSITSIKKFVVDDKLYASFVDFVKTQDFKYESKTEKKWKSFSENFKPDSLDIDLTQEMISVQKKIDAEKEDDFEEYKTQIKEELRAELISRYYLKNGVIEASLSASPEVIEALRVLQNDEAYKELLKQP